MKRYGNSITRKPQAGGGLRTLLRYIAHSNRGELQDWVRDHNIRPSSDPAMLVNQAGGLVAQRGEPAIKELMEMHPDKEMIVSFCGKSDSFLGGSGDERKYYPFVLVAFLILILFILNRN